MAKVIGISGLVNVVPGSLRGHGAPPSSASGSLGQSYFDIDTSPPTQYIYNGSSWAQGGNELATTTSPGIVLINTDGTLAGADDTTVPTSLAVKTYADALAIAGSPVATEAVQGIGELATDAEAVAGTASTALKALFVTPSNFSAVFASPPAIGGTVAAAGTFGALTADGTGTVTLTSNAASVYDVTGAGNDLTLSSDAGRVIVNGEEAAANAITLLSAAGGIDADCALQMNLASSQNAGDAIRINASAGGIDIDAAGAAGEDITIDNAAGSVSVSAGEAIANSIVLSSTNGGIDILCPGAGAGLDIDIVNTGGSVNISSSEGVADAINIDASAGGVDVDAAGQVNIASSQNAADAVRINASAGGIDIDAAGAAGEDINIDNAAGSINITSGEAIANSLVLSSGGGLDILAPSGGAGLDIDITNTGGSVNVSASEAAADAISLQAASGGLDFDGALEINIASSQAAATAVSIDASNAAGGVTIAAGTGGLLFGNQADCTTIDLGDFAPTASRTITLGGGTVVTAAVTDLIDIAPDGATTNADSIKQVDVLTGTVATGQSLLNLATGAITSGTHTVSIQSGNAAAGTVACNISTGTGTKTVNVGNADAATTVNVDGVLAVNNNVNANVSINDGTSTGTVTIGNGAAGAIAVDSGAGISLDAATASNFACAAGDLTIDATAGSLILSSGESANDSIQIIADNGGIDISAAGAAAGEDIDIAATGSSVNITSTEAVGDAIVINASDAAGGIDLMAGTGSISSDCGRIINVTAKTNADTPYAVTGADHYLTGDTSAGVLTFTLPAAPATGQEFYFYDIGGSAGANNITLDGNGNNIAMSGTTAATKALAANYSSAHLVYNGTIWMARYDA